MPSLVGIAFPATVHRNAGSLPALQLTQSYCFLAQQSSQNVMRMPSLVVIAFPSTGHPDPIRALRHP